MSSISKFTTDAPRIVSISQSSTLKQAAEQMLLDNVGCLIVNNENGDFVGLLTERDIACKVARYSAGTNGPGSITVAEAMTRDVLSVPPTHRIRHLPIVDDGVVVGILSARDLMSRQILEDRAAAEEVAMLSNCLKSIDLDEAAQTIVKEAPKLFGARHCVMCLFKENPAGPIEESNADGKELCLVLDAGDPACRSTDSMLALRTPARPVASQVERPFHKTHCAQDDQSEFYCESIPDQCEGLDAQPPRLVIPLRVVCPGNGSSGSEGHLAGCLCMCGLPPSVAANRELIAYKAGLAKEILTSHLTNAALYQQARITSLTDALTGAGSRKLLEDKLESESARADRYKRPFSVAIIDIDNFKTINDTLGHAAGDEAIRKIALCMKNGKRTPDILVRYGGDEFVILMPETKAAEASVLLERLRLQVHDIRLGPETPLSMSCGIAEYSTEPTEGGDQTSRDVMRRADITLYEAKSAVCGKKRRQRLCQDMG
jgi:diguanylate cyclase (GGDEF)-like protein